MSAIKNYFEFFGIKEKFDIDLGQLRRDFIANSKKFHPDFHTESTSEEQEAILELSTINNEAWKILSDLQRRIAHLLDLHDQIPEEGKAQVPQEFLMDMMEINEALMELEMEGNVEKKQNLIHSIEQLEVSLHEDGRAAMKRWDEDDDLTALQEVRDYYLKLKYIDRIKQRIK